MKTKKVALSFLIFSISLSTILITFQSCQETKDTENLVKVGTYDSRVVALVFYQSDLHGEFVKQLKQDMEDAEESGDDETIAKINKIGPGSQDLAHKQVFSNMPIPNILELISDSIPVIAERFQLDVIMNKWGILYQKEGVEYIDVTKEMLTFFEPSEETLEQIDEMFEVDPIPLKDVLQNDVENWCPEY